MADDTTQPGVQIKRSLWEAFRQDVRERKGSVRGHLANEVETAIREYINASEGGDTHDRLTGIESELKEIRSLIRENEENKKDSGLSSRTETRLKEIRQEIDDETDGSPKVHDEVIELAIRRNAGASDPTMRRYKKLLKQDNELFPHPTNESLYFRDPSEYVQAVNAMRKGGKIESDTYTEITQSYGEEWWLEQLEKAEGNSDDSGRMFQ